MAQELQLRYGIVDIAKLMRDSEPGKAGIKFIENEQTRMQKKLDEIQARLEKSPTDQNLMQELQRTYGALQQKIQTDGQQVATRIYDVIVKVLDQYRTDNNYTMLLGNEAVASYDPSIDVTEAVLALVNKEKLEFTATPLPDVTAPEAAPAKPVIEKPKSPASGKPAK